MWVPLDDNVPRDRWIVLKGGRTTEDFDDGDIDNTRPVTARWNPDITHWDGATETFHEGVWQVSHWDGRWRDYYLNPTHYFVLPE